MKSEILKMLRESEDYVSGQQICEKFGVSRTAVWKAINQLKEEGYEVEAVRNKGYRILASPDVMTKEELESQIDTVWLGKPVIYFDEIGSTNNYAKQLGENGGAHGTLVVADMQSAGKGRRGRGLGFSVRIQHLYDAPSETGGSGAESGVDADPGCSLRSGRRNFGTDRASGKDQMAQ